MREAEQRHEHESADHAGGVELAALHLADESVGEREIHHEEAGHHSSVLRVHVAGVPVEQEGDRHDRCQVERIHQARSREVQAGGADVFLSVCHQRPHDVQSDGDHRSVQKVLADLFRCPLGGVLPHDAGGQRDEDEIAPHRRVPDEREAVLEALVVHLDGREQSLPRGQKGSEEKERDSDQERHVQHTTYLRYDARSVRVRAR